MPAGPFPVGVSILRVKCELSFHRYAALAATIFAYEKMPYGARQSVNQHAMRVPIPMDEFRTTDDATEPRGAPFKELDDVVLATPIRVATTGRDLPAGAHGTVVGVWRNGAAYEVEFTQPFACLVTLRATSLRA
jgi:hypothetical protein